VIVVGIAGDLDAATRLKQGLDAALGTLGFRADERPFHPHLTLGRTKDGPAGDWKTPLEGERETEAGPFDVQRLTLFESLPGPGGSQYRVVRELPLASADAEIGDGPRERS
jgi:2'-5' RNA ligase